MLVVTQYDGYEARQLATWSTHVQVVVCCIVSLQVFQCPLLERPTTIKGQTKYFNVWGIQGGHLSIHRDAGHALKELFSCPPLAGWLLYIIGYFP